MELNAVLTLSALANKARLAVFRALVKAGPKGLAAGAIANQLNIPANTLSAQLNTLSHADLIESERDGRSVIYRANFHSISTLIIYLMDDCCEGSGEVRLPVYDAVKNCC